MTAVETLTTTGTVRLAFEVVDDEPFDFVPGQFVAIDMTDAAHGYRRSPYCLMDGSETERRFELLVRRVHAGPVSVFLSELRVDDLVGFRGPSGHSMLLGEDHLDLVMIATGVGVSPCYCLLRHLDLLGTNRAVRLFWGLRLESDICLVPELERVAATNPEFGYAISLSRPSDEWRGLRGRVTESVPSLLERLADTCFFLVGNGAMVAEMSQALLNLGVRRERIYEESFFDHRFRPSAETVARIEARFVAHDIERPIDRLARELGHYGESRWGS